MSYNRKQYSFKDFAHETRFFGREKYSITDCHTIDQSI